ncbi:hypothetical protein VTN00DRAFT_2433 [Thermoascus crustaceus]|uniref:uncharacterized protein n=1 Tax=Thermoascus crustaceus TaxID=5088 RepID=UPI0037423DC2
MASDVDGPGAEFADPEHQSLIARLDSALTSGFMVPPDSVTDITVQEQMGPKTPVMGLADDSVLGQAIF